MSGEPPLRGVRVVELSSSIPGQVAGMLLADLGAEVVRLVGDEPIDAGELPGWLCWNRGKQVVAGTADLDRLLARADVLLADHRPSELAAAGLDAASLQARHPALVPVWLPAMAASGRWSELPHDQLLLDAISGFAAHHPATEERPVASVVPTRLVLQGELGAVAALAGLLARERDGWGRAATVTGLHATAATLNTLVARAVDAPALVAPGKLLPGAPNFRLYQGSDGGWLYLAALSPDLFIKALEVLDRLDVFAHPLIEGEFLNVMRPEAGAIVGAELDATFATATADEWIERFRAAGVPAARLSDPDEWLAGDIVAHASPPVRRTSAEVGEVLMPATPVTLSVNPPAPGELPSPAAIGDPAEVWVEVEPQPTPAGPRPDADDRPLAGLRVLDLATFLAGPFVSTLLADFGADVVKVESPAGDPYSVFTASYASVNDHKQRFAADLADPAARQGFLELAGHADVVVDNLIASSLARLDLGAERFDAVNPTLVRCSVTAYGADGPYAELPGFDPIMQTLSGLAAVQGGDGRPVATAAPAHDAATGCAGAIGTLAALWVRQRDGYGQRVFTSLAATSGLLQSAELTTYAGRPPRPFGGPDFAGPSSYQRLYAAADRWLAVSATTDAQRAALLAAVRRSDLEHATDDHRAAALDAVIAGSTCDDWIERFAAAGVPAAAAIFRTELDDPFLVEHRYSRVIDTPHVGRLEVVGGGYVDWANFDRQPPFPVDRLTTEREEVVTRWTTS